MKQLNVPQSGSQADKVASRNRYGQYLRTRAMPTQPRSDAQVAVRASFTVASKNWKLLSEVQRSQWTAYADNHPRVDSLGQTIRLTGFQQYVGVNTFLDSVGFPPVVIPPNDANTGSFSSVVLAFEPTALTMDANSDVFPSNVAIYLSPPRSAGVNYEGTFRLLYSVPFAIAGVNADLYSAWSATFGEPVVGQKIFIQLLSYDNLGNVGALFQSSAIIS